MASGCPEALTKALEKRFLDTASPKNITLFYSAAQGNGDGSGADHFAHKGMSPCRPNMAPKLGKLVLENEIEGYNLPQGTLSQFFRDIAAYKIGTVTHVG